MQNVENRISALKTKLEQKRNERTRAEANLEMAEKQLQEVTAKIRELGYEPEQLPGVIEELEARIASNLAEAEKLLQQMEGMPHSEVTKEVASWQ